MRRHVHLTQIGTCWHTAHGAWHTAQTSKPRVRMRRADIQGESALCVWPLGVRQWPRFASRS